MCNEAPDTRIAQQAAVDNAQISKDALEWYKQTYTDGRPTAPQPRKPRASKPACRRTSRASR
jgi:hypothetical protein